MPPSTAARKASAIMTPMPNSLSRFKAVLGAGWILLGLGAVVYARMKSIPGTTAVPVAAAFLIEFPFYLSPGFSAPRRWLENAGKNRAACLLTVTALLPWLVYTVPTGEFRWLSLAILLIVAGAVSFWYVVLPVRPVCDALFLAILAAAVIGKIFDFVYPSVIAKVPLSILGHIMLIRTAALALLVIRGNAGVEFRFMPARREWITGFRYFALMLPVIGSAYWALGLVQLRPQPLNIFLAAGTFLGFLWVVGLSEEFVFRGLMQQWIGKWTASSTAALFITSLLFGSAHLWFHGPFPSWRFATLAAILGLFCGMAWRSSQSIQASMVTHALAVTFWRVFFR